MEFDVFEYTNRGGRKGNEDAVGYKLNDDSGLFVVADGLGGHQFGELASSCVCDTLLQDWNGFSDGNIHEWIENQLKCANQSILNMQKEKKAVLKSTVTVLGIDEGTAVWANVGDTRLYYIHNSDIAGITNDHSVAFKKYRAGEISRDEIRQDEDQSCLLRTLGGEEHNEPEFYEAVDSIEPGDGFFLCSDGVWEYLYDEEILIDFLKAENAKKWAELLLLRIMARINGANDNLSILTIMCC